VFGKTLKRKPIIKLEKTLPVKEDKISRSHLGSSKFLQTYKHILEKSENTIQ